MDGYHIALFFHLFALLAAAAATAVMHIAESRLLRAGTAGEARQWHALMQSTSRTLPAAIVVLFATGAWMVSGEHQWSWAAGWIEAGVLGLVLLGATGAAHGRRSDAAGREIERLAETSGESAPAVMRRDPVVHAMGWSNTGLALAVVFVMTTKPSLGPSLLALAIGIAAGVAYARASTRSEADVAAGETAAG